MKKILNVILTIACGMGIQAKAATIAVSYSFAGGFSAPPIVMGTTAIVEGLATGSILSGNQSLNTMWNPVTVTDHSVVDLTTGLLNGTFVITFADGDTLFGNLFEKTSGTPVGPFTQTYTFTGGTGAFAGAAGSLSGAGVADNGFTTSGNGTINAPAIPEPASAPLLLSGLVVGLFALRRSKMKTSSVLVRGTGKA